MEREGKYEGWTCRKRCWARGSWVKHVPDMTTTLSLSSLRVSSRSGTADIVKYVSAVYSNPPVDEVIFYTL